MAGKSPGNDVVSEGACESRHLSERTGKKNNYLIQGQYHGEANTTRTMAKDTNFSSSPGNCA